MLENNVTGRNLHDGTTNLVIDLKKRQVTHEEKLNYDLNIGSRRFKCTTIPIVRKEYGVVGAICVNVDTNFLTEEVLSSADKITNFFKLSVAPICSSTRTFSAGTSTPKP